MLESSHLSIREYASSIRRSEWSGGLAVVSTLAAHGTDVVFGIPGTHNLELYRHLDPLKIRAVTARHEQGAGYAADGYAQVARKPGIVITTSGPALINVLTAAATAYAESRPMIVISPGMPLGAEGLDSGQLHESKDSTGAVDRLLAWSRRVSSAEAAAQAVADAFEQFERHRPRPVHIEIPIDVLTARWSGHIPVRPVDWPREDPPLEAVEAASTLLRNSRRPLIIAGGGARSALHELLGLAETLGSPVVTTSNGKGVIPERHPLSLGANVRRSAVQEESRHADVLLVVGSELGDAELWGGSIGQPHSDRDFDAQRVIRIDIDPSQLHKNLTSDLVICGDSQLVLHALLSSLRDGGEPSSYASGVPRAAALWEAINEEFDLTGLLPSIASALQREAGEDLIVAGDSSQVTFNGALHSLVAQRPGQFLYMAGFATLGYGIPAAVGAKVASPGSPVVALVGDGAAMFSIQEIMMAVEMSLPVVFVIVDNGGYAEIEEQMETAGFDPVGVRLARPNFAALGEAMGAHGLTISVKEPGWQTSLAAIFEGLADDVRPHVIEIKI